MGESSEKYATYGMRVQCSAGTMENYISTDRGHGVNYKGKPLLNANDHVKGVNMEQLFEALYDERRNAIPSWQGYHFQGMMALLRFLEVLVCKYKLDKNGMRAAEAKLKIEWLEDFIIYEKCEVKEIYQIKKTLTKANREEVLRNFIIQFKLLGEDNAKWILGYDNTVINDLKITQTEFEQLYKAYIEDEWLEQIKLLQDNYKDNSYWKKNLNLKESTSTCKSIRAYVRQLMELEKEKYEEQTDRKKVCINYLEPLKKKLEKENGDFEKFKKAIDFQQVRACEIDKKCMEKIEELFAYVTGRNEMMTERDILDKLYADLYEKMMSLEEREQIESFEYELMDVKRVFLDRENSIFRWKAELYREKERFQDEITEGICNTCTYDKDKCSECILHTIKEWDMCKVVDNVNLEYASFSVGNIRESQNNKISDLKRNLLLGIMEKFKLKMELKNNEILGITHQYAASTLIGGSERINKTILKGVLDNYWEHSKIYRDYESVLTQNYNHRLDEENLSFLRHTEKGAMQAPLFDEIRNTKFIHYEGVKL